jgi:hypothetical protein
VFIELYNDVECRLLLCGRICYVYVYDMELLMHGLLYTIFYLYNPFKKGIHLYNFTVTVTYNYSLM